MRIGRTTPRGFTLIEIMIVIGIIAVVMTAGIPMFWKALAKDSMAKAVNDVLEGCKTARDRAILQNAPYDFIVRTRHDLEAEFNVEASQIRGQTGAAGTGSAAPAAHGPTSLMGGFPRVLSDEVAIRMLAVNFVDLVEDPNASEARVRFFPNGTCDDFTIVLERGAVRRTVTVDIITGTAYELIK
jgi:prepilin-type N-terminal cleavage/methylation domain-containing protein